MLNARDCRRHTVRYNMQACISRGQRVVLSLSRKNTTSTHMLEQRHFYNTDGRKFKIMQFEWPLVEQCACKVS